MPSDDVEMKPSEAQKESTGDEKKDDAEKKQPPKPITPLEEIKNNILLIERAVATLEPRFTHRVLRSLTALRKKLDASIMRDAVELYPSESPTRAALLAYLPETEASPAMDLDVPIQTTKSSLPKAIPDVPECEVYLRLLLIYLLLATESTRARALELAHDTVTKIQAWNRRTMDPIGARIYTTLGRAYELVPSVEPAQIRALLLSAQRTASLRRDDETLGVLVNLLLRNYLHYNLYSQADKLVAKVPFPESAGNPQLARHYYYVGRIRAVQLNYSDAHEYLQQATRRAPSATVAPGFYQIVHKFFIVVELLMGDIPERSIFRNPVLEKALSGYYDIVKAVRTGSLSEFQAALAAHAAQFTSDGTYTLILRLRQNVIKTGIRQLSLAYSRISLRDICYKLHLDTEEDAEYIVGKAIRDGVIEGRLKHKEGCMECDTSKGGYGADVSEAFSKRIKFCLNLHNESVKAMRYPLNAHRKELADAEGAREREKELAKGIADGELDGDDDIGGF